MNNLKPNLDILIRHFLNYFIMYKHNQILKFKIKIYYKIYKIRKIKNYLNYKLKIVKFNKINRKTNKKLNRKRKIL